MPTTPLAAAPNTITAPPNDNANDSKPAGALGMHAGGLPEKFYRSVGLERVGPVAWQVPQGNKTGAADIATNPHPFGTLPQHATPSALDAKWDKMVGSEAAYERALQARFRELEKLVRTLLVTKQLAAEWEEWLASRGQAESSPSSVLLARPPTPPPRAAPKAMPNLPPAVADSTTDMAEALAAAKEELVRVTAERDAARVEAVAATRALASAVHLLPKDMDPAEAAMSKLILQSLTTLPTKAA